MIWWRILARQGITPLASLSNTIYVIVKEVYWFVSSIPHLSVVSVKFSVAERDELFWNFITIFTICPVHYPSQRLGLWRSAQNPLAKPLFRRLHGTNLSTICPLRRRLGLVCVAESMRLKLLIVFLYFSSFVSVRVTKRWLSAESLSSIFDISINVCWDKIQGKRFYD